MPEVLSDNPSLQEILWNFSCFNDEKKRLNLKDNPHFYAELPTSPETYREGVKIDPIEDFRHANEFYVLRSKLDLVHIMTDRVSDWQSFGNFWCPHNAIIFKGLGILFLFSSLFPDILPDICGRLRGESIIKASLRGRYCGFCEQLPVSTIPTVSTNRRGLRLQPIITEGCSQMGWKCSFGYLPMHSSVDNAWRICTGRVAPDSLVCCDIMSHLTASPNVDIALGSLTTNV